MIDKNLQSCFIRSVVDTLVNPSWLKNCNFINLYSHDNKKRVTCLYITDDRRTILYVTDTIFATGPDGQPWSQKYAAYLKDLLPSSHSTTLFYYSGLHFDEYTNDSDMYTLKEYMRLNAYDSRMLCDYIRNIRTVVLNYHIIPFCFSEDMLLVDAQTRNILLPSSNLFVSIAFPLPEDLVTMFKNRLHPYDGVIKEQKRERGVIARTGAYDPIKMKQLCTRIIDKEATIDRVFSLSSIIYYVAKIGTLWRLQKQWLPHMQHRGRNTSIGDFANVTNRCVGLCSHVSPNNIHASMKRLVHNYLCIDIVSKLPIKMRKSTSLYTYFDEATAHLERYLRQLDE